MDFYETDELGGQIDNWVGPTVNCLLALCRAAGFARVDLKYVENGRAGVLCRRVWDQEPSVAHDPRPIISSAVNNRTGDVVFNPGKDEYICLYFRAGRSDLDRESICVEIDGLGVPVITLAAHGDTHWQANMRVPPGLGQGVHSIRVRLANGHFSDAVPIWYGMREASPASPAAPTGVPSLYRVSNGLSGSREFRGYRNEHVRCCFCLPAAELRPHNIVVEIGGREVFPYFVGRDIDTPVPPGDDRTCWQANVKLPSDLSRGRHSIRVKSVSGGFSNPQDIILLSDKAVE